MALNKLFSLPTLVILLLLFQNVLYTNILAQNESAGVINQAELIYSSVNSPFCPGRLLRDCPSRESSTLKEEIKDYLKQGISSKEVIDLLFKKYGESINATPDNSPIGVLFWIVPIIFIAIGTLVLRTFLQK
jgi:cytochrome c-type biogenesis protein CcmH/NrfF